MAGRQEGRACGGRELTPFVCMCGRVLLRAGWRRVAVPPVCPGKQCLEESVLWLVLDSDFFCCASEPRSCCAFSPCTSSSPLLSCPPLSAKSVRLPPSLEEKKKSHAPRVIAASPVTATGFPTIPHGAKCVTNQFGKKIKIEPRVTACVSHKKKKRETRSE